VMVRTQITLESELQRRAKQRVSESGVSLADYVRRLLAHDLKGHVREADPACVFDLGKSGGANVAKERNSMIAHAFKSARKGTWRG
jgi:hypothetical protein